VTYGLRIWLALALIFVPAIQAYLNCGTLDAYPYVLCLSVGAGISLFIAVRRRKDANIVPSNSPDANAYEAWKAKGYLLHFGPPFWLLAVALFANQFLDRSTGSDHKVHLLGFRTQKKGPSTVLVESWRSPDATQSIRYVLGRMGAISTTTPLGQRLIVSVRAGALGWPWIENIRLAEPGR
jgi:hypothetical protein